MFFRLGNLVQFIFFLLRLNLNFDIPEYQIKVNNLILLPHLIFLQKTNSLLMKTIAEKLLIKPGKCWLAYNTPLNFSDILPSVPAGLPFIYVPEGNFDGILLFVLNHQELKLKLAIIVPLLTSETIFWIVYPKKTSGITSDLAMMAEWNELAKYGLRTVTAVSVDETWTALRFRPEGQSKISDTRNDQISNNEYAEFIDIENRQIKLPPEMELQLGQSSKALNFYHSLSFSNKKEYLVWILSAKQEKTKIERLNKLTEKLLNGKKNPAEK